MTSLSEAEEERITAFRAFNRFWTKEIGALEAGLLETPYSLTEARVVFELAQGGSVPVTSLRSRLDLDSGYLSRVLARLREAGLVAAERSSADARRQVVRLTEAGRDAFALLDARAADQVRTVLGRLGEAEQRRLVGAMAAIRDVLAGERSREPYVLRPPLPGELGWIVERHGALYAREYGWDETFEALVARILADYVERGDAHRERGWIAEVDGEPAGCVFCMAKDATVAQLRLLLVEPRCRGLGVGARLVAECVRFARRTGYSEMTLWTNDVLVSARRIYEAAGFELAEEERHRSFGHDLVGQNWRLSL